MSSLASDFHSIGEDRAIYAFESITKESLTLQTNRFRNIIYFANDITKKNLRHIGEQHLRYNLKKWKKKGDFDILNDISENITLVQLMDTLGNLNHPINIVGYWIFDSNN